MSRPGQILLQPSRQFDLIRCYDQTLAPPIRARMSEVPMIQFLELVECERFLVGQGLLISSDFGPRGDGRGEVHRAGGVTSIGDQKSIAVVVKQLEEPVDRR